MEPANVHLQEQLTGYYSSLLCQPEYKLSNSNNLNPGIILDDTWPHARASMSEGLSFYDAAASTFAQQSANDLLLSKIKDEMPDSIPKLSEFTSTKLFNQQNYCDELGENQWCHSNFFSGPNSYTQLQLSAGDLYSNNPQSSSSSPENSSSVSGSYISSLSHLLPSISTADLCSQLVSSSLDLNLQAVDLLNPTQNHGIGHHFMRQLIYSPSSSSNKVRGMESRVGSKKRSGNFPDTKNLIANAKKQRSTTQSACPPLKVRKEKLGDRIATLQRLAAPYGKTDTASVLTEAIGYIQFLHEQVQTLSLPYLRPSNNKPTRILQTISSEDEGKGQPKRCLLSRGLCLVPTSYASYFNSYSGFI